MTDKPTPTDAELKAMWQLHAADIGGIFCYVRAVLAKWGQPAQAAEPVAVVVPCYTPSGKRVALYSAKQDFAHRHQALHSTTARSAGAADARARERDRAGCRIRPVRNTRHGACSIYQWFAPWGAGTRYQRRPAWR